MEGLGKKAGTLLALVAVMGVGATLQSYAGDLKQVQTTLAATVAINEDQAARLEDLIKLHEIDAAIKADRRRRNAEAAPEEETEDDE